MKLQKCPIIVSGAASASELRELRVRLLEIANEAFKSGLSAGDNPPPISQIAASLERYVLHGEPFADQEKRYTFSE